jgi:hypothetical protein
MNPYEVDIKVTTQKFTARPGPLCANLTRFEKFILWYRFADRKKRERATHLLRRLFRKWSWTREDTMEIYTNLHED